MSNDATVLAVCVNWNGEDVLPQTLASLLGSDFQRLEIVVVNHASSDGAHVPTVARVGCLGPILAGAGCADRRRLQSIGSGAGDCAPAPSHTTGRTVFSIRRLESPEVRWSEEQTTSSISDSCRSFLFRVPPSSGTRTPPFRLHGLHPHAVRAGSGGSPPQAPSSEFLTPLLTSPSIRSVRLLRSFAPPALPGFFATMTSADFSKALTLETSPSKVLPLSPRAARLYLVRLDGLRVSLFLASSPPAPGLTAGSCPCGRGFAFRFLQLHLAATPCGSAKVGSITSFRISHPLETAHVGHTRGGFQTRPM